MVSRAYNLEEFIEILDSWGLTDVMLPFLLIFVVIFALMAKTRILGEDKKKYNISAELPGLNKGDIEITFHDGMLEIKGEQKKEIKEEKEGFIRREFSSASYYRAFNLPEDIDEDTIDANLDKGILSIKIAKKEPEKKEKKKIEVK